MKTENGKLKKYKLGELCNQDEIGIYGIPATAEEFSEEKIRYLRITDISDDGILLDDDKKSVSDDNIEKYILQEGDIVFARTGNSTGRAYLYDKKDGILAFAGFLIKYGLDKNKVNPKFLRYYTIGNTYKQWVKNLSVGSTRGNISAKTFAECPISLPDRKQQDFTVDVLSALDDKIALNRRMNEKLEQMAKRLYDHWFVQFDFPNADGKPYKSSGGKMEYNEALKREIPDEWEVKKLGDVCEIVLGGTPSTANNEFWDNGTISWLNSGEVGIFPIVESEKKITEIAVEKSTTEFLKAGSVTLSITRYLRPSILAIDACINQSVVGIKENDLFKNCFLYPYLQNEIDRLMSLRTGAQQPHINKEIVEDSFINIPPKELMEKYKKKVTPIYLQIINIAKETQKLTVLRDRLLPLLMNGQVEVR